MCVTCLLVRHSPLELCNCFVCFFSLVFICFDLLLFSCDVSLDLEELGLDDRLRPMSKTPDEPIFDYDIVHRMTGGPRGADRNFGRGGRMAGRTVRRAGRTQGRAPDRGEQLRLIPINRGGGSTSRRRPREPEAEGPQKRQSVEVNST